MVEIEGWAFVLFGLSGIFMAVTFWIAGYQTAKRRYEKKEN